MTAIAYADKSEIDRRDSYLVERAVNKLRHENCRLGDLPVGAVVFHPYWKIGRVSALASDTCWVLFPAEFDAVTRVLVRESKLLPLAYTERVAVWQTNQ